MSFWRELLKLLNRIADYLETYTAKRSQKKYDTEKQQAENDPGGFVRDRNRRVRDKQKQDSLPSDVADD